MSSTKQQAVISAAITLFAQHGLAGTTMEAVAAKASVSKRTLYKYYENKEALFEIVVDMLVEQIRPLQGQEFDASKPLKEQLAVVGEMALKLTQDEDYLTLSRIVMVESLRSKEQADKLHEKFGTCEQGMYSWFIQAEEQGFLQGTTAQTAATLFYGGLKKVAYWDQVIKWGPPAQKQALDDLVELTCRIFTQPPLK